MKPPRYSSVELLIALVVLLVTSPFVEDLPYGDLIEAMLVTAVMISAVVAVGGSRRAMIIAMVLLVPALVGKWVNHLHPNLLHPIFYLAAALCFFGFVVARLLRFVVRAPRVDANVLCAGVSGFLILGLTWATAYIAIARLNPNAFSLPAAAGGGAQPFDPFSAFYFSFITLCTVGYGDIVPVSKGARMLAVIEAVVGLFYMAVLISRLVSLHTSSPGPSESTSSKQSP